MNHRIWQGTAMLALACTGCASSTVERTEAVHPGSVGVQTLESQTDRGALVYAENCAGCHGDAGQGSDKGPPVVGEEALPLDPRTGQKRDAKFRTAFDVYRWTHDNMPPKKADSLTDEEYLAVMAFALTANGVDLDGRTLDAENATAIVLHDDEVQP